MAVIGAGKRLSWSNYTEDGDPRPGPTPNSVISAGTSLGIDVDYQQGYGPPKPGKVVLKCRNVKVTITLGDCWVATGQKTNALLNHEQGHYRIQELGAKELDAALAKIVVEEDDLDTAQSSLSSATDDATSTVNSLIDTMQDKYDSAPPSGTNHGLDPDLQSRWDLKMRAAQSLTGLQGSV